VSQEGHPVAGVLRELGRSKISTISTLRALKFFLRISTVKRDRLIYHALEEQRTLAERGKPSWGLGIKTALGRTGLGYLWERIYTVRENLKVESQLLERRLLDIELAETTEAMTSSRQLNRYATYNNLAPGLNMCYDSLTFAQRRAVAIFRLNCVYSLPIRKRTDQFDMYQCTSCSECFLKEKTWSHFLYYCSTIHARSPVDVIDPLSLAAFSYTTNNSTKDRIFLNKIFDLFSFIAL
jgi:hypothetical protein